MSLVRFLLLALVIYVVYRLARMIFTAVGPKETPRAGNVIDEMVQDPQCKVYVPKKEAVRRTLGGQTYYFCSETCARQYEAQRQR